MEAGWRRRRRAGVTQEPKGPLCFQPFVRVMYVAEGVRFDDRLELTERRFSARSPHLIAFYLCATQARKHQAKGSS